MPSGFVNYDDISYKNMNGENDPAGSLSPFTFLCITLALVFFGLLVLYSASFEKAVLEGLGHYHYFIRQVLTAFLAVVAGLLCSYVPLHMLLKGWYVLLPVSLLMALGSLLPGFSSNGHIVIDDLVLIQPGLLCSVTAVLVASDFIPDNDALSGMKKVPYLLSFLSIALLMILSALSSGLGYYVLTAIVTIAVFRSKHLPLWGTLLFLLLSAAGAFLLQRLTFISGMYPALDAQQAGYCLKAARDGGVAGVGIGSGLYKLDYLAYPESFQITAVLFEETGIIGFSVYILLLLVMAVLGFRTAGRARRRNQGKYEALTLSLTAFLVVPAALCAMDVLSILPLPGLILPYAGYSIPSEFMTMLVTCILYRLVYLEGRSSDVR